VQRTGDTVSGALTVSSNLYVSGAVRVDGIITNATYYGNGVGLTNIPASAVAEADPIWASASNGIQSQIDDKTPLAIYQAGTGSMWMVIAGKADNSQVEGATNDLWTALGNESAVRGSEDVTLSNQIASLQSGKLSSNIWATADSTTNYVRRTGDTISGLLTVSSNLHVNGALRVDGDITNATYYGNGVGLTNIPASAVAEADPRWGAASNGIQSQIDGKTPLATYQAGTGSLWTAVNAKAAQSAVVTATNDLWTALSSESAARGGEDITLSNQVTALQSGKLASNIWAVADSTTNYVRRTGDTVSGVLNVSSNLNVSGGFSVGITQLVVLANGNVGIGTSDPTNRLAVNGTIKAREVLVTADNWPDYVFDANYKQMPLDEVAVYIQNHGHLPGVPSANDIDINGVGLGAMQGVLLKKIEELTLQMIELKKENAEFRKRLDERNGSQGKRSE